MHSARLYGVEPVTGRCDLTAEEVEAVKSMPPAPTCGPTTYAESAAMMIAAHRASYLTQGRGRQGQERSLSLRGRRHLIGQVEPYRGPMDVAVELSRPARRLRSELADDGVVIDADRR